MDPSGVTENGAATEHAPAPRSPPARKPTLAQKLLGVFVAWQLLFILGANGSLLAVQLFNDDEPPGGPAGLVFAAWQDWATATGQFQGWCLFAPRVPDRAAFAETELRWNDGTSVRIAAAHLPAELTHFYRPFSTGRMTNYHSDLRILLLNWTEPIWLEHPSERQPWLHRKLARYHQPSAAYLKWQYQEYCRRHPEPPPPDAAILWARLYDIGAPGQRPWNWPEADPVPMFRWRPNVAAPAGCYAVEVHDWTTDPAGAFRWMAQPWGPALIVPPKFY